MVQEVLDCTNFDLDNIVTPVQAEKLDKLLIEAHYDSIKRKFLVNGFKNGFSLQYEGGLRNCKRLAPNLKL